MFTVVLSPKFEFESREELVNSIIYFIKDECIDFPEDILIDEENPESWTDNLLRDFFIEYGGDFLSRRFDLESMLTDAYNECNIKFESGDVEFKEE